MLAVIPCLHASTRPSSRRPSDGTHTVLWGAADYKWSLRGLEGGALEAELRRCHLRSADRMVKVAGRNGGVYIKAGQHLGQMVGAVGELLFTACRWPCARYEGHSGHLSAW
jgi:predicted unusual protein kinase regulating ubiquinone biosynthesis (AarF/ABC1/UbiB family)